MKKIIAPAIALLIKTVAVIVIVKLAFNYYDEAQPFYKQHLLIWVLIYLPLLMGYESLAHVIFTSFGKKQNDNDFLP